MIDKFQGTIKNIAQKRHERKKKSINFRCEGKNKICKKKEKRVIK